MEALVIRLDLDPDAARLLELVLERFDASVEAQLAGTPPQHTKAALESQAEHVASIRRELARAVDSPEVVHVPDPSGDE
jgi:hypothetical protein